jgi:hypothetical protein
VVRRILDRTFDLVFALRRACLCLDRCDPLSTAIQQRTGNQPDWLSYKRHSRSYLRGQKYLDAWNNLWRLVTF